MSLVLSDKHESTLVLTLNRPDRLNTMTLKLLQTLRQQLETAATDPEVRVVVLCGAGRSFCAGADLQARQAEQQAPDAPSDDPLGPAVHAVLNAIENLPRPVIAAVHGHAVGGGLELALACDFRYAAAGTKLGLVEARVGSMPGAGGTQRLPRLVGPGLAKELMFTAEFIDAETAQRIGLVNRVFPDGELLPRTLAVAKLIATRSPLAIQMIKRSVNGGLNADLHTGLQLENLCMTRLRMSEDRKEGIQAFLEKRPPQFTGR